jgi:hypothetical protein
VPNFAFLDEPCLKFAFKGITGSVSQLTKIIHQEIEFITGKIMALTSYTGTEYGISQHIYDDPSNMQASYSFLSDSHNEFTTSKLDQVYQYMAAADPNNLFGFVIEGK